MTTHFFLVLQPTKCTRNLSSDSSHKFNQIELMSTHDLISLDRGRLTHHPLWFVTCQKMSLFHLQNTKVFNAVSVFRNTYSNKSSDVKECFLEYSSKHIIWCQGELLYARFKVPASSGSLTALVSQPSLWSIWTNCADGLKQLDFRSLPHGSRTMWMPQFGFFSGINISLIGCLNKNSKIVLFPRKDQLPERGNAQWTDAFYRGRRSSRIQVPDLQNQIWYHLCPTFCRFSMQPRAPTIFCLSAGKLLTTLDSPLQLGTQTTSGAKLLLVQPTLASHYKHTVLRRMEDLKNGQLDITGIEHINEIDI